MHAMHGEMTSTVKSSPILEVECEFVKCKLAGEKASQVRTFHDSVFSKVGPYILMVGSL